MDNVPYAMYSGSLEPILQEFKLNLKYTFGDDIKYVGTTTKTSVDLSRIRDVDIMVVFSQLSDSHVSYIWKIIKKLHAKYHIFLHTRLYSTNQLSDEIHIPLINKYLLKIFLDDLLGKNPFADFSSPLNVIKEECVQRIREQAGKIVAMMPHVASDPNQIKAVAQSVYDGIRAFLIIENHPIASKEEACSYFSLTYPEFFEANAIYNGYLDPHSVVDVANYILDSLAIMKHLLYKSERQSTSDEILLINTPSSIMPHPRDDYLSYDPNMPLGLVCISSYLEREGYRVKILDSYAENLGALSTIDRIFRRGKIPKIIGINSSSPNIHIVHKITSYIKRIQEKILLVCGGPHATLATEHTLSTGNIDYAIVGEGELPFSSLVKCVFDGAIEKIGELSGVYRNISGQIVGTRNRNLLDLSEMPTPNLEHLPLNRYFSIRKRIYIHTSRGCAFNCTYCSVPRFWDGEVREIPNNILKNHLSELIRIYKPDEFQVVDDNFSHRNGKLIKSLCKELIDNKLELKWKCQARADQLEVSIVEEMARAGCFEVDLGIESGNKETQKYVRKNLNLEKTLEVVTVLCKNNIFTKAFFMLGFPEESYGQISDTINYAIKLKNAGLNDVAFFPVMPFPGTAISKITGKEVFRSAVIDDVDIYERSFSAHRLRKYSAKPELSLNSKFTPEELRLLVKFAYQRFNLEVEVKNLETEFKEYVTDEERNIYGI